MRKALLFMVAVALVAGGLRLLGAELFFALKIKLLYAARAPAHGNCRSLLRYEPLDWL